MQSQIPRIIPFILEFEPVDVEHVLGSLGLAVLDFAKNVNLSHPEINFKSITSSESEFLCEVLQIARFSRISRMKIAPKMIHECLSDRVNCALELLLESGFSSRFARLMRPHARERIRSKKKPWMFDFQEKTFHFWSRLPDDLDSLSRGNKIICKFSEKRFNRFKEIGCDNLADSEKSCSCLFPKGDFGFFKANLRDVCALIAKIYKPNCSSFALIPAKNILHASNHLLDLCKELDYFEDLNGMPVFDHHIVLASNPKQKGDGFDVRDSHSVLMGERNGFFYFVSLLS